MKAAFCTLGCRVNQYETEAMTELFIKNGYQIVNFDDFADVYVINTCTVTSIGDKKSRQMIRKSKKTNKDSIIVVAGCYAQVSPDEVAKIEGVDVVIGTKDKGKIIELIEEYKKNKKQIKHIENIMSVRKFEDLEIEEYQDRNRAFLKIQDGCDRFCSYCLIPYARGPVRSKEPEKIYKEVQRLSKNGFKEVILSGIHVASYGKDLKNVTLADIIEGINKIDGIERIRIGSIDPLFFTEDVVNRISKVEKLCHHFHISLQSGCDDTLKRMNRHYTSYEYKEIIDRLRNTFDDLAITTDVIVGFPGETDDEFNRSYEFIKDIKFSKIHVFKYSKREGTKAADLKNEVDPKIKEERSKRLLYLDKELENNFIKKHIGKKMDVLFENKKDGYFEGYTKNYIRVKAKSEEELSGLIRDVLINGVCDEAAAMGEIL
ncbi:MAG TPA: tRNA (N(6)-L-threonylcarbamoyladenosine(37)-C(2))-methylthiotransferase MtaB [Clostridiaceae bacterium]|nr:tRNA (N(6)-L-threonylcarbamoyladenosine(37)-C(2))-methylthiotransferase MtaB [Clostridiaceae bacterium]